MAKESIKARNIKRLLSAKKDAKRLELKKNGDYLALDKLPKNESPVRRRNRCALTGRSRGFIRRFGLSRLVVREFAMKGKLPGVMK